MRKKITSLEIDMGNAKKYQVDKIQERNRNVKLKKCNLCDETFERNCDLETNLENYYEKSK